MTFSLAQADSYVNQKLGVSDWVFLDQTQVNVFGEVTRWRTPGHCDPEFGQSTPYGGTILHGFHMVSLCSWFIESANLRPTDASHSLNYGMDKVRVLKPVVIGEGVRLRSHISLLDVQDKGRGEKLLKLAHEVEVEGVQDPALYAEYLSYWFPK